MGVVSSTPGRKKSERSTNDRTGIVIGPPSFVHCKDPRCHTLVLALLIETLYENTKRTYFVMDRKELI